MSIGSGGTAEPDAAVARRSPAADTAAIAPIAAFSTGSAVDTAERDPLDAGAGGLLRQPTAVWATADASVVAFMGIGLVDPILPSIARGLSATPSQSRCCSPRTS